MSFFDKIKDVTYVSGLVEIPP